MSTHENTPTEKLDVYARVTDQIINAIEKGVGNWKIPWHTSGRFASSPINATTRKAYRGINTVCLWAAAEAKGYDHGEWATYAQWQERKAQVRRTLKYLIYGGGEFVERLHDVLYDSRWKLRGFALSCSLELFGTVRPNDYPPVNLRIAKGLRYLGFEVIGE